MSYQSIRTFNSVCFSLSLNELLGGNYLVAGLPESAATTSSANLSTLSRSLSPVFVPLLPIMKSTCCLPYRLTQVQIQR